MSVYVVVQVEYTDKERYDRYTSKFWDVFTQFNGKILVNDESPEVLEGEWKKDKMVILEFPDSDSFMAWATSEQYTEIAKDRLAGADATIVLCSSLN